jgi:hypothetical protein
MSVPEFVMPERGPTGNNLDERLERGEVLYYPTPPFVIPDAGERAFLATQHQAGSIHKNISYDPATGRVNGHTTRTAEETERLREVLTTFSRRVTDWLAGVLPRYSRHWRLDRVSYRPLEEATRQLRLRARNDLLHVDSFPTRPTDGWRIHRVFVNLNETDPRIWVTSDPFARLLERYGRKAGLPRRGISLRRAWQVIRDVPHLFRSGLKPRSEYDAFMLRFHNFLKACDEFQERSPKRMWSFPPGSVWMCMTDTASHAVLRGRYALEHSYFIAPGSLALPLESPPALLARACGVPVLPRAA